MRSGSSSQSLGSPFNNILFSTAEMKLSKLLTKGEKERDELTEENTCLRVVNACLEEEVTELKMRHG